MQFIDSNVVAYAFYSNEYTEECQNILRKGGILDSFNLAEAFHIIEKETDRKNAIRAIRTILKLDLTIVDVSINIIFESIKRAEKYNLSFFDLIHYTTALLNNCDEIVSYDTDFNNLEIKRVEPL